VTGRASGSYKPDAYTDTAKVSHPVQVKKDNQENWLTQVSPGTLLMKQRKIKRHRTSDALSTQYNNMGQVHQMFVEHVSHVFPMQCNTERVVNHTQPVL